MPTSGLWSSHLSSAKIRARVSSTWNSLEQERQHNPTSIRRQCTEISQDSDLVYSTWNRSGKELLSRVTLYHAAIRTEKEPFNYHQIICIKLFYELQVVIN